MFKRSQIIVILAILLLSVFLIGCTSITVVNESTVDGKAVVWVREPDYSRGGNFRVGPGESTSTFSAYGGSYSVTVTDFLVQEATLLTTRSTIIQGIHINQNNPELVAQLRSALETYNNLLLNMEAQGVTCRGYVPDWGSVTAIITWNPVTETYNLSCTVESSTQ